MQQWYQCPNCGSPVAFGTMFCGNCRTQLNWPTQQTQPPPAYQQPQQQEYYRYRQQTPEPKKTSPWLTISLGLIAIVVLVGGAIFAINRLSQGTPSTSPSSPPSPSSPASPPALSPPSEPLKYRELDSFTAYGGTSEEAMRQRAVRYGYELPDKIVMGDYYALYIVVQNLDDVPGTFKVTYTLTTADKAAAERQMWLRTRTPAEYAELNREYYEGSIKLYLEPGKVGVAICPPGGIYIAPGRVPFGHEHQIIPDTKMTTVK